MAPLLAKPFTAAFAPICRTKCSSCRPAVRRNPAVVAAQRQQQQQPEAQQQRQATVAAAVLGGSLAISPEAVAAAAATDPQVQAAAQTMYELAALDSATAGTLSLVLKPLLSLSSLLMIVRIVMSWYPELDGKQLPWSIAYTPTEPLLVATRKLVPPFNGLDVSPIVWVALLSFLSEILTGPQGILSLIARKGI